MEIENTEETDRFERLFFWTGDVAHLIDKKQTLLPHMTEDKAASLCGRIPMWPSIWFGRTEEDAQRANEMSLCGRCSYIKEIHSAEFS